MSESNAGVQLNLERYLHELPVLPTVVASLMSLDKSADDYFEQVLDLIAKDPSFTARLLASANSAQYASRAPVTDLRGAIARIGSAGATNLVLSLSVARVFVPHDDWEKSLWRHAVQVAIMARGIAARAADQELSPDTAYACGLLHDIGRFVLFQEAPDQLRQVDEGGWDTPAQLVETERAICGLTHAELGAAACEKWGLPIAITELVRDHHKRLPDEARTPVEKLTAVVRVADVAMFPSTMPGSPGMEDADDETLRSTLLDRLAPFVTMKLDELRAFLHEVAEEAGAATQSLGVG